MATTLSFLTDPAYRPGLRHGPATLIASLALGTAPWLERDWLASVGALPDNFAASGRSGGEECFHELFAATGLDYCLGAAITFYSPFDDVIHLTSWTDAESAGFYRDWVHELAHATGHPARLGRDLPGAFGPVVHGMEDLIAEIAAAIVCLDLGFSPGLRHPACCPVWIALLRAAPQSFACAVRQQKRFAKDGPVPCVVRLVTGDKDPSAEEDSLAENVFRQQLHPLDQFRAMQTLADQGSAIDDIAARFMTTPAVVRQRLKLASVAPALCDVYADDGMTLEQLMAFSVSDDHARQVQVWEIVAKGHDRSPYAIRRRLTEDSVRATDRRVLFVGLDAYLAAGGTVMRDLFEEDRGGWLQDVGLLDQLVMNKLGAEGERIGQEGWKWVAVALDFAYGHADAMRRLDGFDVPIDSHEQARLETLEAEIAVIEAEWGRTSDVPDEINQRYVAAQREMRAIGQRPIAFDPADMALAGVFVSLDHDGTLDIARGFVRPADEPANDRAAAGDADEAGDGAAGGDRLPAAVTVGDAPDQPAEEEEDDAVRPLPDRLVTELTVHRTLALGNALAANPSVAFPRAKRCPSRPWPMSLRCVWRSVPIARRCLGLRRMRGATGPGPRFLRATSGAKATRLPRMRQPRLIVIPIGCRAQPPSHLRCSCRSAGLAQRVDGLGDIMTIGKAGASGGIEFS